MKLTYDPRRNIAYMRLRDKQGQVETVRVGQEINIDLAPDGKVYGIEFLNANEQLQAADDGNLVVIDPSGRRHEVPLAR